MLTGNGIGFRFCRTKRTSDVHLGLKNALAFAPNAPRDARVYQNIVILPHQTHLRTPGSIRIPLFCRTKRTSGRPGLSEYLYFAAPNAPRDARERFCAGAKAFFRPRGTSESDSVRGPKRF